MSLKKYDELKRLYNNYVEYLDRVLNADEIMEDIKNLLSNIDDLYMKLIYVVESKGILEIKSELDVLKSDFMSKVEETYQIFAEEVID